MLEVLGIAAFAFLIIASIALHEVGHMVPAKKFGVKVTEYMVGFGPMIWSRVRGETKYGVKLIPLGGYVRMIGMLPPPKGSPDGVARGMSTGRFAAMVQQAREQSLEEVGPGDEDRVFYKLPPWKRIVVMLSGPFMNLVIAVILFTVVLVGIGSAHPSLTIGNVSPCTPTVSNVAGAADSSGECSDGSVVSPSAKAGLMVGDRVVSVNGVPVSKWEDVTMPIVTSPDKVLSFVVVRDGVERSLSVPVALVDRPIVDRAGQPTGGVRSGGYVGISPEFVYVRESPLVVPAVMWDMTVSSVKALVSLPERMWELLNDTLIGGEKRAVDGPVSVVGVSRLGGEVVASEEAPEAKAATFLSLAASLNLFLFLFNLLPILPLDGGHVLGAVIEMFKRGVARVRGRPMPGPVDISPLLPVAYVVAAILVGMSVIVIWADLVKPITLG